MFASLALAATPAPTPALFDEHQAACAGKEGWSDPAPPVRIYGNVYDVGTCGIVVLLVTGPKGHILIDGATAEAAAGIAQNIQRLGFRLNNVKLILASHEHVDHVGGVAELQRLTGAELRLSPAATHVLSSGKVYGADPQYGAIADPPAARPGKALRDGETVSVGPLRLKAHFTPGHVGGGTSWTWRSCGSKGCLKIAYADSLTAVSAEGYRFSDHPVKVAELNRSFRTVSGLPCDLLITPHPGASNLYDRLAGKALLVSDQACRIYAARGEEFLAKRLAKEAGE